MKKLFILLFVLLLAMAGFSQYPIQQNLGSSSTLVQVPANGALRAGLINRSYTDTTAANASNIKYYPASFIFTTLDSNLWFRSKDANMWILIGGSSGGATGAFWGIRGNIFPVIPSDFGLGTNDATNLPIKTNGVNRVILPSTGLGYENDTSANKPMVFNTSTKSWGYSSWFGGGSGVGLNSVLQVNDTLTQDYNINSGFHQLMWDDNSFIGLNATGSAGNSLAYIDIDSIGAVDIFAYNSNPLNNYLIQLRNTTSPFLTRSSNVQIYPDSIVLNPYRTFNLTTSGVKRFSVDSVGRVSIGNPSTTSTNGQITLTVGISGANANSGITTTSAYFSNTHTGTTSTNYGSYSTASGASTMNIGTYGNAGGSATNNYGAYHLASGGTTNYGVYIQSDGGTTNYGVQSFAVGTTGATNIAGYFDSHSGAVANYAIIVPSSGGSVGIGTTTPNASAKVDITSTTQGFLPPRMTGTQAEAISSPAEGLLIYSTDGSGSTITSKGWWGWTGSIWAKLN